MEINYRNKKNINFPFLKGCHNPVLNRPEAKFIFIFSKRGGNEIFAPVLPPEDPKNFILHIIKYIKSRCFNRQGELSLSQVHSKRVIKDLSGVPPLATPSRIVNTSSFLIPIVHS